MSSGFISGVRVHKTHSAAWHYTPSCEEFALHVMTKFSPVVAQKVGPNGCSSDIRLILLDPSHLARHAHTLTNRHKCCHSSSPLSLIIGGWGTRCKCVCVCVCWRIPLPGGKCWLLMSFFYSFHKTQSHRLNWASGSHTPISLTVPHYRNLSLSLPVFGHGKTHWGRQKCKRASGGAHWLTLKLYSWG